MAFHFQSFKKLKIFKANKLKVTDFVESCKQTRAHFMTKILQIDVRGTIRLGIVCTFRI